MSVRLASLIFAAATAAAAHAADFNGDGRPDLVLLNRESQSVEVHLANATAPGEPFTYTLREPDKPWRMEYGDAGAHTETGDFNGDGFDDLLIRRLDTNEIRVLLYAPDGDGVRLLNTNRPGKYRRPEILASELLAVGDFDGDSRSDLLFRDPQDGRFYVYMAFGLNVKGWLSGASNINERFEDPGTDEPELLDWTVAAVGDFDGDSRSDLLLYHARDEVWSMQLMDARDARPESAQINLPGNEYSLEAAARLDGDDTTDLLFRNQLTGEWLAYLVQGAAVTGIVPIPGSTQQALSLHALADFDGDGGNDMLLRHGVSGAWRMMYLQDAVKVGNGFPDLPDDLSMRLVSAEDLSGDGLPDLLLRDGEGRLAVYRLQGDISTGQALEAGSNDATGLSCPRRLPGRDVVPAAAPALDADQAWLSWRLPQTRQTGEPLCGGDIAGFHLFWYSTDFEDWGSMRIDDPLANGTRIDDLDSGRTYRFGIRAIDRNGRYSRMSTMGSKTIP